MRSRLAILGVIILIITLLVGCTPPQLSTDPPGRAPGSSISDGQPAPEIILPNLQGQTIKLSDYRGKVVILNFWASWCPPCKAEMPELERAYQEFSQSTDAVLLTVNLTDGYRETTAKARQYMVDNHFTMPVLLDTKGKAADDYNITSIPTTVIIDKQGNIRVRFSGATTMLKLQGYVNQLK